MTHKDIYTKFMIEYDKANVTSSYPSLTQYEGLTILDKAYLALVGLKFSGNNVRNAQFEKDTKAISDLQQLNVQAQLGKLTKVSTVANEAYVELPSDFLFAVGANISFNSESRPMQMITHEMAKRFYQTYANKPWIKYPVYYIEDNKMYILYDMSTFGEGLSIDSSNTFSVVLDYIRRPNKFAYTSNEVIDYNPYIKLTYQRNSAMNAPSELDRLEDAYNRVRTAFYDNEQEFLWKNTFEIDCNHEPGDFTWLPHESYIEDACNKIFDTMYSLTTFELNDAMAEELISLAVTFALENVESGRLNTKLNIRGLEA